MTKANKKPAAKTSNPPPTWRVLVENALRRLGGRATLAQLYEVLEEHPKAKINPTYRATIRRTLQFDPAVERVSTGVWQLNPKK